MISGIQNEMARIGLESGSMSTSNVIESFESIFIAQIVRGLREAFSEELSSEGGNGKGIYMSWFDQAMSEAISKAGGLGLKDQLERFMAREDDNNLLNQKENSDIKRTKAGSLSVFK